MMILNKIKRLIEKFSFLLRPLVIIQNKYYNHFYPKYHQISPFTLPNRYPHLFSYAKDFLEDKLEIRILSFGCSTGEECFALAKHFPKAKIIGVDINPICLKEARKKNNNPNIVFLESSEQNLKMNGPYNLIFCMSVLCRWPATKFSSDIKNLYSFEKFEGHIQLLDTLLQKGGFLFLTNANYQFSDTSAFENYIHHTSPEGVEADLVPKYSKEHKRLNIENFTDFIYQKK